MGTGDTDPIEVGLKITNEAAVGTKTVVLEFTPKDNVADIYPTVYVKFKYTIDEFAPVAQFVPSRDYSSLVDASNNTAEVKGKLVNDQWKFEVALSDLFTIKSADAKNYDLHFVMKTEATPDPNDVEPVLTYKDDYDKAVLSLSKELTGNSKSCVLELHATRENGEDKVLTTFTVNFTTPFVINIADQTVSVSQSGGSTTWDVSKWIKVVENNASGLAIYEYYTKDKKDGFWATNVATDAYKLADPVATATGAYGETTITYSATCDKLPTSALTMDGSKLILNGSAQLSQDAPVTLKVTVKIEGIVVLEKTGTITLTK